MQYMMLRYIWAHYNELMVCITFMQLQYILHSGLIVVTLRLLVLGCTAWHSPMSSVSSRHFHGFQSIFSGRQGEWE